MSQNIQWKHLIAASDVRIRRHDSSLRLSKVGEVLFADRTEPWEFTCLNCDQEIPDAHMSSDWKIATCSNCYSESLMVSKVRLTFHNWGEQNGGDTELMERYNAAKVILGEARPHGPAQVPKAEERAKQKRMDELGITDQDIAETMPPKYPEG